MGGEGPHGEDPLAPEVAHAAREPGVVAALADVFRHNCRDGAGERRLADGEAETLAREVVRRLLDPDRFRQAEVADVRFDLEAGSDLYPRDPVIWASVWEEDEAVWRSVGRVDLPLHAREPTEGPGADDGVLPLEVAAGVIVGPRGFLLARRRQGDHMGGRWEFPGGKREAGEGWEETLSRELQEELGVRVRVGPLVGESRYTYPDTRGPVLLRFYACRIEEGDPQPFAADVLGWFPPDRLAALEWPAANLPMVQRLAPLARAEDLWAGGPLDAPGAAGADP